MGSHSSSSRETGAPLPRQSLPIHSPRNLFLSSSSSILYSESGRETSKLLVIVGRENSCYCRAELSFDAVRIMLESLNCRSRSRRENTIWKLIRGSYNIYIHTHIRMFIVIVIMNCRDTSNPILLLRISRHPWESLRRLRIRIQIRSNIYIYIYI